jgi:hypothetical protein
VLLVEQCVVPNNRLLHRDVDQAQEHCVSVSKHFHNLDDFVSSIRLPSVHLEGGDRLSNAGTRLDETKCPKNRVSYGLRHRLISSRRPCQYAGGEIRLLADRPIRSSTTLPTSVWLWCERLGLWDTDESGIV